MLKCALKCKGNHQKKNGNRVSNVHTTGEKKKFKEFKISFKRCQKMEN